MIEPTITSYESTKTLSQWLKDFPLNLRADAIGLWQIVSHGQSFGFKEQALIDYVKLAIRTVLDAGAVPVYCGVGVEFDWVYKPHYGVTHDEIVKNIMQELSEMNYEIPNFGRVWFAHPDYSDIDIAPKEQKDLS